MKCHVCLEEMIWMGISMECYSHATIAIDEMTPSIRYYILYFERDNARYRLSGSRGDRETVLTSGPSWLASDPARAMPLPNLLWRIPTFIIPDIKDGIYQPEELANKLSNLKAFM
jgi:hypothetical protein